MKPCLTCNTPTIETSADDENVQWYMITPREEKCPRCGRVDIHFYESIRGECNRDWETIRPARDGWEIEQPATVS